MMPSEPQSHLTPAQSAVVDALFDPAATLASIARAQNLTLEGLLELVDTPAVRRLLHRLMEIEAIRRRLTAAAPISAALRTLTKLLDSADSSPIELRRAATSILRSCSESGVARRSARDPVIPRHSADSDHAPPVTCTTDPTEPADDACDSVPSPQATSTSSAAPSTPWHLGTLAPLPGTLVPSRTLRLAQAAGGPGP